MPSAVSSKKIFQFKIILKYTQPKIWRRIEVPEEFTFWELHSAIQDCMGWSGMHPHNFKALNPRTGRKDVIGKENEDLDIICEKNTKIADYFLSPQDKASYLYDFGDKWDHRILLESIEPAIIGREYPQCIAGKQACPPDDCGGVWGYQELLEIRANPNHEDYEERMEWLGEEFDPDEFDPKSVEFDHPDNAWEFGI
ncbi:uncharacterized protein y4hQ-like [Daktulosphaira vitifoliae]|uniref:uncharacterized protein y4hQ-like n=1 Tax=Daktulosphaira vitifoliae TaxID=58002 RepID=UPI0021AA5D1E|nr:uncharacterized protein y4hQ-like [Daktulosphaira vitifoliae]XP_050528295.1 uncharacterized protein y4hQ-like [Daktulosphaira vitifoliae]